MNKLNVAIIGTRFMGRAHSHAWRNAAHFFELPAEPVLKVACGRDRKHLEAFARHWGWESVENDWRRTVEREDVDVVDICTPHHQHCGMAVAAAQAGKHILCEKPLALNAEQAQKMLEAAEQAGVVHYVNFNYRRCPAVALAKRFIEEGKLGRIHHWRGVYFNSFSVDPTAPLRWTMVKETAGSGPLAALGSHSVDLARYLVGEIRSVSAMTALFVPERPLPGEDPVKGKVGKVTTEDAAFLLAEFENGALGSLETSRFATGRRNYNSFEIYGSRGSLLFNLERMNELEFFSLDDPEEARGFRTILATERVHPYVSAWWPPGHIIGYEHTFIHGMADFVQAVVGREKIEPNFFDGYKNMQVLDAALTSAELGKRIPLT